MWSTPRSSLSMSHFLLFCQLARKLSHPPAEAAFLMKPHSCFILWQLGVFSFNKVCIFLPMVFIKTFITTLCFYDFWKTVLVKKYTPCQGVVWFSLPNAIFFTLAFTWYFTYTIEAILRASEQAAKKVEGTALKLPPGLTCPGPCKPVF